MPTSDWLVNARALADFLLTSPHYHTPKGGPKGAMCLKGKGAKRVYYIHQAYLDHFRQLVDNALRSLRESALPGGSVAALERAMLKLLQCAMQPASVRRNPDLPLTPKRFASLVDHAFALAAKPDDERLVDDAAKLTCVELAGRFKVDKEALRKRLERFRKYHHDGWVENREGKLREARFLYQVGAVRSIIDELRTASVRRSVRQTSVEKNLSPENPEN